MRKVDVRLTIDTLQKFLDIGHNPDERLLKKLCNLKVMDDELFVMLHKNFPHYGHLLKSHRQFEKPKVHFGGKERGVDFKTYKRQKLTKRIGKKTYSKHDAKGIRLL